MEIKQSNKKIFKIIREFLATFLVKASYLKVFICYFFSFGIFPRKVYIVLFREYNVMNAGEVLHENS